MYCHKKENVHVLQPSCQAGVLSAASAASIAGTIKAVLDTPILNEAGELTEESKSIEDKMISDNYYEGLKKERGYYR